MKPQQTSFTAEVIACYRAVESMQPASRRICYDPYAQHFLRRSYRLLALIPPLARLVFWLKTSRGYSGDAHQGIARTRYIDDYVGKAIAEGVRQVVILGAGYDSRALRIEGIAENARVFELDRPATQAAKQETIRRILGSLPPHVRYVPIEFNRESLERKLLESGYRESLRSLFIWEGVTYFLAAEAVDETLRFVRNHSAPGSSIIFDYTFRSVIEGTYPDEEAQRERAILDRLGEPYTFGIDEGKVGEFLSARGFCDVAEVSPEFLTTMYFKSRGRKGEVASFLPLVHAKVAA